MCVDVVIFRRGRKPSRCTTVGNLRVELGWRPPGVPGMVIRDRDCLCVVDMPKLARLAGWTLDAPTYETGTGHYDAWALREAPQDREEGRDG